MFHLRSENSSIRVRSEYPMRNEVDSLGCVPYENCNVRLGISSNEFGDSPPCSLKPISHKTRFVSGATVHATVPLQRINNGSLDMIEGGRGCRVVKVHVTTGPT